KAPTTWRRSNPSRLSTPCSAESYSTASFTLILMKHVGTIAATTTAHGSGSGHQSTNLGPSQR
ncbi:hypothetical protein KQH58_16710, partial [Mycetohabitans sp. B6]